MAAARGEVIPDGEGDERAPLLAGSKSGRPQSAVVRHGRGLLSEDGDGEGDSEAAAAEIIDDTENGHANGHPAAAAMSDDDDDDANDDDGGLLGWRKKRRRSSGHSAASSSAKKQRRLRPSTIACYVLLALLAVVFIAFAVVHVWIGRFMSEQLAGDGEGIRARAQQSLVYAGPDSVKILSMDRDSTTVKVEMRMGIDVRKVFGWDGRQVADEKHLPLSRRLERKFIGWAARRVGQASMDLPEPVKVSPLDLPHHDMLYLATEGPLTLPLHCPQAKEYDPEDLSWLKHVTVTVPMQVADPDVMATFVNTSMEDKVARVHVKVPRARVSLGRENDRGWLARTVRHYGGQEVQNIELDQTVDLPDQPAVPEDPQDLVDLKAYSLTAVPHNVTHGNSTEVRESLGVSATAEITNPAYAQLHKLGLDLDVPFSWPYKVLLPSVVNKSEHLVLARGAVLPFSISSSAKAFNVSLTGSVETSSNSSSGLSQSLSRFITHYLGGRSNRVYVAFDADSALAERIPAFLVPLIRDRVVANDIPGLPSEKRDLLKDLQMEHLRVHPSEGGGSGWECDGEMAGRIIMPDGLDTLENAVNITSIWPDIVLYDGLPPAQKPGDSVPPVPLPQNAFARFKTRSWAPAVTYTDERNHTIMRATVTNVPLEILNRGVLQRWLAKIILSGGRGAQTGIKGFTQAKANVRAFGGVELKRLPVYGTFYAQKPNLAQMMEQLAPAPAASAADALKEVAPAAPLLHFQQGY